MHTSTRIKEEFRLVNVSFVTNARSLELNASANVSDTVRNLVVKMMRDSTYHHAVLKQMVSLIGLL